MLSYEEFKNLDTNSNSVNYGPEAPPNLPVSNPAAEYSYGIINYILGTAIAILLYLGIPFLVAKLSKRKWSRKARIIFIICNAIISYYLIIFLKYLLGDPNTTNAYAAAIWSWVANYIFQQIHPESKKQKNNKKPSVEKSIDPYAHNPYTQKANKKETTKQTQPDEDATLKLVSEELLKFMLLSADPNRKAALYNGQHPERDDYGYTVNNPICTDSIDDSPKYLSKLRTLNDEEFDWLRTGSMNLKELHGEKNVDIDIYTLYLHGEYHNKIYICPYGKNGSFVPKGLKLYEKQDPRIYGGDIAKEASDLHANVEDVLEYHKKQHEDGLLHNQEEFYFIKEMAENIQQSIPEKSIHNESLFCRKCGTPIPTDSIFCYKCGEKVSYK